MAWLGAEPIEVARAATAEGAEWAAGWLRGKGARAYVLAPSPADGGALAWPVVVPKDQEIRARRVMEEEWRCGRAMADLARCPACEYNLEGLDWPARCPECGAELDAARAVIGPVMVSGEAPRRRGDLRPASVVLSMGVIAAVAAALVPPGAELVSGLALVAAALVWLVVALALWRGRRAGG